MSTRATRGPVKVFVENLRQRTTFIDVDLNVPHSEMRNQEGTSANSGYQDAHVAPVNVETVDDDVMISSPRAFAEAKSNSHRIHRRTDVVDVDSEKWASRLSSSGRNKRIRVSSNQPIVNSDFYINLEDDSHSLKGNIGRVPPPPPPPPPKEPTFNCPVCMGPLVEEMTTKCGHIFCKTCIKAAISAQRKCPTCRTKITMKNTIRIYLPAAS